MSRYINKYQWAGYFAGLGIVVASWCSVISCNPEPVRRVERRIEGINQELDCELISKRELLNQSLVDSLRKDAGLLQAESDSLGGLDWYKMHKSEKERWRE